VCLILAAVAWPQAAPDQLDVLIKGGTVYDGGGGAGMAVDVGIKGDRIAAIGKLDGRPARTVVDASGLAVAPGFVNMLSWATVSLIADGRSQSDIRQGVTTEIFGEGMSMGPLNAEMKRRVLAAQTDITYDIPWTTLSEYLTHLERRGVSTNVASFIGAATIRTHVLGLEDVQPTPAQLGEMRELVRREMEAGALGIGSALKSSTHPRAYGNVARLLGTYVREEKVISLPEAVRRLSGLPAANLGLDQRGLLKEGMFADVVVFDPATIAARATYDKPHQYAVGMQHVFVNGVQVLKDGEHTGATPGRALWGRGRSARGSPENQ